MEPWNEWLWRAWVRLSASRRAGFAALPIPVSEIKAYVEFRHPEFNLDEREEFLVAIQELDATWLKVTNELSETKREKREGEKAGK